MATKKKYESVPDKAGNMIEEGDIVAYATTGSTLMLGTIISINEKSFSVEVPEQRHVWDEKARMMKPVKAELVRKLVNKSKSNDMIVVTKHFELEGLKSR